MRKDGDIGEMENIVKQVINSMYSKLAFLVKTNNMEMCSSFYR